MKTKNFLKNIETLMSEHISPTLVNALNNKKNTKISELSSSVKNWSKPYNYKNNNTYGFKLKIDENIQISGYYSNKLLESLYIYYVGEKSYIDELLQHSVLNKENVQYINEYFKIVDNIEYKNINNGIQRIICFKFIRNRNEFYIQEIGLSQCYEPSKSDAYSDGLSTFFYFFNKNINNYSNYDFINNKVGNEKKTASSQKKYSCKLEFNSKNTMIEIESELCYKIQKNKKEFPNLIESIRLKTVDDLLNLIEMYEC